MQTFNERPGCAAGAQPRSLQSLFADSDNSYSAYNTRCIKIRGFIGLGCVSEWHAFYVLLHINVLFS